jgi:hypothetical protein
MAKLTTSDLSNLQNEASAVTTINNNFTAVETAMENTLSRDGSSPNSMSADLDMNNNNILNLPAPGTSTEPLRVADIAAYITQLNGTSTLLPSAGAGDVSKVLRVASAGLIGYSAVLIDSSANLSPATTDVGSLGTSALNWSDLFLDSGAVVNFDSGNVTVTHGANLLTFAGASSGYLFSAGLIPTANDAGALGSATASWSDLFLANGAVINFNNGDVTITHSADKLTVAGSGDIQLSSGGDVIVDTGNLTLTNGNVVHTAGNYTFSSGSLNLAAGTASVHPLKLTAGTNLTTATTGVVEYDGKVFYATPADSNRGVVPAEQWCILNADYTLTSTTTDQKLFNATAAGAVTLQADTTYAFEAMLHVTGMSATSGNATFNLLGAGTATLTSTKFIFSGLDAAGTAPAITTAAGGLGLSEDNDSPTLAVAAVNTNLVAHIRGVVRVNAAGTLIPSIGLTTAAAAVVRTNSFIKFSPIGSGTVTTVGAWS